MLEVNGSKLVCLVAGNKNIHIILIAMTIDENLKAKTATMFPFANMVESKVHVISMATNTLVNMIDD